MVRLMINAQTDIVKSKVMKGQVRHCGSGDHRRY